MSLPMKSPVLANTLAVLLQSRSHLQVRIIAILYLNESEPSHLKLTVIVFSFDGRQHRLSEHVPQYRGRYSLVLMRTECHIPLWTT